MSFGQMSCPTCSWSLSTAITHLFLIMFTSLSLSYWEDLPCIKVKLSQGVFSSFYPASLKYGRKSVNFLCSNLKKLNPILKLPNLPLNKEFLMGYFLVLLIPCLTHLSWNAKPKPIHRAWEDHNQHQELKDYIIHYPATQKAASKGHWAIRFPFSSFPHSQSSTARLAGRDTQGNLCCEAGWQFLCPQISL